MIDEKKLIEDTKKHFDAIYREDGELLSSDHICISEDVDDLIKLIEKQPKADWIPCEVELPKENIEVWVTVKELDGDCYTQSSWLQDGQWIIKKTPLNPKVIAWMPKPQPYKKEGAN